MSNGLAHIFLVQFSPSPARSERLNVGLIVVRDGTQPLAFRLDTKAGQRAGAMVGAQGASHAVAAQCAAIASRLVTLRDTSGGAEQVLQGVCGIASRLANELVISGPHKRIVGPGDEAFDALFLQLVEPPTKPQTPRTPRIDHQLKTVLMGAGVENMLDKGVRRKVELLGGQREHVFAYAYRNGATHCIQPERFPASEKPFLDRLSYTSLLARALCDATATEAPTVLALYAYFETSDHEAETRAALKGTNARIWRAGTDDQALTDHVRKAYAQHH